jgi:NAD(P)-dependent dehydrogenase (short-subunit alcohol dehydrogenase family)
MDLGLDNARVVITGGASNIGRGIVHAFAAEGSRIMLSDIDEGQAEKVRLEALELGAAEVVLEIGDLAAPGAGAAPIMRATALWGGVDSVVSNAGWSIGEFLAKDDDRARWQKLVDINLFAAIELTRASIEAMRESGGSIVYIASEAAFGQIRQAVYGATKAAIVALARTTAKEHGRHGIRSNIVCPGLVLPAGPEAVGASSLWAAGDDSVFNQRQIDFLLKDTPLGQLPTAEDVANTTVWLSSTAARQLTGQLVSVSGGYTMP